MLIIVYTYHYRCPRVFCLDSEQIGESNILSIVVPWAEDSQTSPILNIKKKSWQNQCLTAQNSMNTFWFKINVSGSENVVSYSVYLHISYCALGQIT